MSFVEVRVSGAWPGHSRFVPRILRTLVVASATFPAPTPSLTVGILSGAVGIAFHSVRWAGAGAGSWSGMREKYCWLAGAGTM